MSERDDLTEQVFHTPGWRCGACGASGTVFETHACPNSPSLSGDAA